MTTQWKHLSLVICAMFAGASLAAVAAGAAPRPDSAKSASKTKSPSSMMSDSEFAKAAAEGGMAEVKFGELAEDKASNKAVKDLSQRMVDDHTKADDDLKTAASKDNVALPNQMDAKDQAAYARLSQLSGTAFDREYARDMVRDHEADIAAFRHEANDGKDAALKSFAAQTLPTLEDHLKQARQTLQTVEPATTTASKKRPS